MKPVPTLEKWLRFHDTYVGWVFDHPVLPNGTHMQTGVLRFDNGLDLANMELHCAECMYKLGEPGTVAEHDGPGYLGDIWKPSLFKSIKRLVMP